MYKNNSNKLENKMIRLIVSLPNNNSNIRLIFRINSSNKNFKTLIIYYNVKFYKIFNKTVVVILN